MKLQLQEKKHIFQKIQIKGEKMETINFNGETYVLLKKEAYNFLVASNKEMKNIISQVPANDQVSLEEKVTNLLAKGGAAL